jgi:cell division protein FtsL
MNLGGINMSTILIVFIISLIVILLVIAVSAVTVSKAYGYKVDKIDDIPEHLNNNKDNA